MSGRCVLTLLLLLAAVGCAGEFGDLGLPDTVSDTGFEGTWRRGNERIYSFVSIVSHDDEYRFRLAKIAADGRVKIDCDWQGQCEEIVDGERAATYRFKAGFDEQSGRLRVEWEGRVEKPAPLDIHRVEEMNVRKQGSALRVWTIEDNNGTYEYGKGPRRDFEKVSDFVVDPPDGWQPRGG